MSPKRILILAANPQNTSRLRLDQEVRDINDGLQRKKSREQFMLEQRWATRPRDVQRAMLDISPQIIHFSGHGLKNEGLVLEDEAGNSMVVSTSALVKLFGLFSGKVDCVVLNSCYSEPQAKAISQHVPYVIGTDKITNDKVAIEFSVGFYDALAAGNSIEFAYEFGCAAVQLSGIDEDLAPILIKNAELEAKSFEGKFIEAINKKRELRRMNLEQETGESGIGVNINLLVLWVSYFSASLMILVYRYFSVESFHFLGEFYFWPAILIFWWYISLKIIPRKWLTWIGGIVFLILFVWFLLLLDGQIRPHIAW
jgi:hypothetical protein